MSINVRTAFGNVVREMATGYRRRFQSHLRAPDRQLGKTFFGNVSGVNRNLTGYLAKRKSQFRTTDLKLVPSASEGMEGDAEEFVRKGFTSLGRPYDQDLMDRIRDRYEDLLETDEYTKRMHSNEDILDGEVYRKGIIDPVDEIPELTQLLTDHIRNVIKQYYGSHFQVRIANAYRTRHIPPDIYNETEVFADNWHTDGKSTDHIKLFVTLSDTSEEHGPLHILNKDDVAKIADKTVPYDRAVDGVPGGVVDDIGTPFKLTGERGTAMLGNTTVCLHRAGNPDPGETRDIIQFYIAPAHEPWPDEWTTSDMGNTHDGGVFRLYKY